MPGKEEMEAWFEANRAKFAEERSRRIKENAETFSDGHSRIENNGEYVSDKSYDVDDMLAKYGHISEFLSQDANDANRKLGSDLLKILSSLKDKYREGIITEEFLSEIKFEMYDTPSEEYYEYLSGTEFVNEISKEATKTDRALTAVRLILDARFSQTDSAKRVFTNKEIAKANKFIQGKDEIIEKEYMDELIAYAKSIGIDYFSDELLSGGNVLGAFNTDKIKIDVDDVNSFDRDDFLSKFSGGEAFSNAETDYAKGEYARNVEPYFGKKQVKMLEKENKNVFDCILINGHSLNNLYPEFAEIKDVKDREKKLKVALLYQSRFKDNKIEYVLPIQKEGKTVFTNPIGVDNSAYFSKERISDDELVTDANAVINHVRRNALGIKVSNSDLYDNIIDAVMEYGKAQTDEAKIAKAELLKKACAEYLENRKNPITTDGKTRFNNVSKLFKSISLKESDLLKNKISSVDISRLSEMILILNGNGISDAVDKNTLINDRRAAESKAANLISKYYIEGKKEEINELLNNFKQNILQKGYDGMDSIFSQIDSSFTGEKAFMKKNAIYKANSEYVKVFEHFGQRLENKNKESFYAKQLMFTSEIGRKIEAGFVGTEDINSEDMKSVFTKVGLRQSDRLRSIYFNSRMFRIANELSKLPEQERKDRIKQYATMEDYFDTDAARGCVKEYYDAAKDNPVFDESRKLLDFKDDVTRENALAKYAELFKLAREITAEYELPDILNPNEFKENRIQIAAITSMVIECSQNEQMFRQLGETYFNAYDSEHRQSGLEDMSEIHKRSFEESDKHMNALQAFTTIAEALDDSVTNDTFRDNYYIKAAKRAYGDFCKECGKLKPGMKPTDLDSDFFAVDKLQMFYPSFQPKLMSLDSEKIKNYVRTGEYPSPDFMDTVKNHLKEIEITYKDPNVLKTAEKETELTSFAELSEEEGPGLVQSVSRHKSEIVGEKKQDTPEKGK